MPKYPLSSRQKQELVELLKAGVAPKDLVQRFGVTRQRIEQIGTKAGFSRSEYVRAETQRKLEQGAVLVQNGMFVRVAAREVGVPAPVLGAYCRERGIERPLKHGPTGYNRGCRCEVCVTMNRERQIERRKRLEKLVQSGQIEPPHHGHGAYTNWGCRCPICRTDFSRYNKPYSESWYKREAEKIRLGTSTKPHGRQRYVVGCRCSVCKAGMAEYNRARYWADPEKSRARSRDNERRRRERKNHDQN